MNNPFRAALQRHVEARRLLRMGGPVSGGRALEIGCGRGVGAGIVLDRFGAETVDAFDLDHRMVRLARRRLARLGDRAHVWTGDASAIPVPDETYDAVFDFGIVHHMPRWRDALAEVWRVMKPGGRFYAEEVLRDVLAHPIIRRLFHHPEDDRFDRKDFLAGLEQAGFIPVASRETLRSMAWFVADKPPTY
ncbi:MAG: methyltransferase domain-containing protein [Gemmatimonadales bacterium]|nr:methyltransferase domain-containing protein [Gemmatimonadales bacterium]